MNFQVRSVLVGKLALDTKTVPAVAMVWSSHGHKVFEISQLDHKISVHDKVD